jgi:hypothetical protein
MLTNVVKWLIDDWKAHKSPYVWIFLTLVLSVSYTKLYSTPAHEFHAANERLGRIEEKLQQKEVEKIKDEILRLEWDDEHGQELNEYETKRLRKLKIELPDEERYLEEIRKLNAEGNVSSALDKLTAFS